MMAGCSPANSSPLNATYRPMSPRSPWQNLQCDELSWIGASFASAKEPVPYSREALRQDLTRVRIAWEECQTSRDPSVGHVGRCSFRACTYHMLTNHSPQSFSLPLIVRK